eukprot:10992663-Alexandrium_andersonii.AAC.1
MALGTSSGRRPLMSSSTSSTVSTSRSEGVAPPGMNEALLLSSPMAASRATRCRWQERPHARGF